MSEENKRKKIVVSKRKRGGSGKISRKLKKTGQDLPEENPLLSQAPKSSIAAMMINRHNEAAKQQRERQKIRHQKNGISESRDLRFKDNDRRNDLPSFVKNMIRRF